MKAWPVWRGVLAALLLAGVGGPAAAQTPAATAATVPADRNLLQWLERMHEAGRARSYVGTFVVLSAHGQLASARIAHVCDGRKQMEHIEALTGPARSTFRHNNEVVTFLPGSRMVVAEQRESLQVFPQRLRAGHAGISGFYALRQLSPDRVAGFDTDVIQIDARDELRYGYRIWSERRTGLVMQMQTLSREGQVLEQVAFSELRLDAPVRMERLARQMARTEGYRVQRIEPVKTTPEAEGWLLRQPVPGFESTGCQRRAVHEASGGAGAMQWTFSDGLATVSLFIEPWDRQRHAQDLVHSRGATQLLGRRLSDTAGAPGEPAWWITAVGEVPQATLEAFVRGIERRR